MQNQNKRSSKKKPRSKKRVPPLFFFKLEKWSWKAIWMRKPWRHVGRSFLVGIKWSNPIESFVVGTRSSDKKEVLEANLSNFSIRRIRQKVDLTDLFLDMGRGCSTAVERSPRNLEVVGSNPVGCWAFFFFFDFRYLFLLSFTIGVSFIRSLKDVHF